MNIIADPASARRGGSLQLEIGNDNFFKPSLVYNTGLINDRFAATIVLVSKPGDGYVRGTWTEEAENGVELGSTSAICTSWRPV